MAQLMRFSGNFRAWKLKTKEIEPLSHEDNKRLSTVGSNPAKSAFEIE
jgi:hypothetical protein